jgi:peptidoglycan/xylan/chitin deacetylase (PgdA/CDA1 family)
MKIIYITFIIITVFTVFPRICSTDINSLKQSIEKKYAKNEPVLFSQYQKGIKNYILTNEKIIALTFDACGRTPEGSKLNIVLINYLVSKKIPAALFISGLWLNKNSGSIAELSQNPLFEIENHGLKHKPASVNGRKGYGIIGTENISEFVEEVEINARRIEEITGRRPVFYRSGTAFFDDVAIKITYELNHIPVNFSINPGDFDEQAPAELLAYRILNSARNGSIILMHMNHPENKTLKALEIAIPVLIKNGFRFVKLEDYKNKLK